MVQKPKLIVGVDPGTTLGLAALDLNGGLLLLTSGKNFSKRDVLSELLRVGVPVVIASDRVVAPHLVSEIASSLGARVFLPSQEPTVEEKMRLVGEASQRFDNQAVDEHQSAALYAALKAYAHYRNLFEEAEEFVEAELQRRKSQLADEVKALCVKDIPPKRGLRTLLLGMRPAQIDKKALKALKKEAVSAKERLSSLEVELSDARAEIRRLRERHVRSEEKPPVASVKLQETQRKLRKALHELWDLRRRVEPLRREDGWIRLWALGPLTVSTIRRSAAEGTLVPGRVAHATRVVGTVRGCAKELASVGIDSVVIETYKDKLKKAFLETGIMILKGSDVAVEWRFGIPWVRRVDLEKALKSLRREIQMARRQRIKTIIDSYREERL